MKNYMPVYKAKNREHINRRNRLSGSQRRAQGRYIAKASPEIRLRRAEQKRSPRERALKTIRAANRRARVKAAGGRITKAEVDRQLIAQSGLCWYCNAQLLKFHIDHVVPLVRGGTNQPDNIVLACPSCNQSKGTKTVEEWAEANCRAVSYCDLGMTMRFKRQSVKVATFERGEKVLDQSVGALVLGALAVHKPLQGGGFCLTHIPSGYKMAEAWKQVSVKALAEQLHALPIDWSFTAEKPSDSWFEYAQPVLREFNSRVDR